MSLYLVVVGGYLAYVAVVIGGDWVVANRFFVPILPLVLPARGGRRGRVGARSVARAVALAALGLGVALGTYLHAEPARMVRENRNVIVETQRKRFGVWLRTAMPPQTLIATGPSGAIPTTRGCAASTCGASLTATSHACRARAPSGRDRTDLEYVLAQHRQLSSSSETSVSTAATRSGRLLAGQRSHPGSGSTDGAGDRRRCFALTNTATPRWVI